MTREEAKGNIIHAIRWNDMPKKEALEFVLDLLEQTRWIPVSERLPKEGEEVLVSGYDTYNKKVIVARYQGEQYGFTCGLVSAWMPLPAPYKAESEE